jgi:hypothetical protein
MKAATRGGRSFNNAAVFTALLAGAASLPAVAAPQKMADKPMTAVVMSRPAALPTSVLLFPATVGSDAAGDAAATATTAAMTPAQQKTSAIVTDAVRSFMERGKVGVVVYSRRLPSIQRAVAEGVKPEDAAAGPGDDPRKAQRFAEIAGANEYLTETIDNYKYDPATRTATFDLSLTRFAADGTGLGASAQKAIGTAPAEVLGSHQEAYAVSEAARVVAEQSVEGVYPQTSVILNPPKPVARKRKGKKIGGTFLVPVLAVGAAIIAPHT